MKGAPDSAYLKQAAAAGLRVPLPALVPLWAEHVPVVSLFGAMRRQWVAGFDGRPTLNLAVLPLVERRIGLGGMSPRRARSIFMDLQVMEAEGRKWHAEQHQGG